MNPNLESSQAQPVQEIKEPCSCNRGIKELNREEYLAYLDNEDWDKLGIEALLEVIHRYALTGGIICLICEGRGSRRVSR